jgi:hypothetical protein
MNEFLNQTLSVKRVITEVFVAVGRPIERCHYEPKTLKGPLNLTKMLDEYNLSTLIEFHVPGSYDLTKNRYTVNIAHFYLDENNRKLANKHARFEEFWELWHTQDIGVLNVSRHLLGHDGERVRLGGSWNPADCVSRYKIAIVIPFRDRIPHLRVNLEFLHGFLQRQNNDYRVFVVEGNYPADMPFNKGRIMNAGMLEVLKLNPEVDCVIYHDVDMVSEDDRNMYTCGPMPRHLSPAIDKFGYTLPYAYLVGGVLAITPEMYKKANGYSNSYWGWGGEGKLTFFL